MSRTLAMLAVILTMGTAASLASAHHSHTIFYDLCKRMTIEGRIEKVDFGAAHVDPSHAGRRRGTGFPIRPLAEIRAHFPDFTGAGVNPHTLDLISMRLVDDSYSDARPGAAKPQTNCEGQ